MAFIEPSKLDKKRITSYNAKTEVAFMQMAKEVKSSFGKHTYFAMIDDGVYEVVH